MKVSKHTFPAAIGAVALVASALLVPTAGARAPSISWSPTTSSGTYDYGAVDVGQTASQTFTLTNSGGSATGAMKISLSGSSAFTKTADACTGSSLPKGKSCAVSVEYIPTTAAQTDTATLTATGKKAAAGASIILIGTGAGIRDLSLSPGTFDGTTSSGTKNYHYDFGPAASITQTFTVTNDGTATSDTLTVIGGNIQFALSADTCTGHALAPSATCTFDVTATAPGSCNPADSFGPGPFAVVNGEDIGNPDIFLATFGKCPL